jgi:hypothetical protein
VAQIVEATAAAETVDAEAEDADDVNIQKTFIVHTIDISCATFDTNNNNIRQMASSVKEPSVV